MAQRILLVNPPIYDFSAYDFWLKPYGLLRVAGFLRGRCELKLFDFLDRMDPRNPRTNTGKDPWGRGRFHREIQDKPPVFSSIRRNYGRYGLPKISFRDFLENSGPFDFILVETVMTYWYPGVQEVISEIREYSPGSKIILGGVYATLCPSHARRLGADLVIEGDRLDPLWQLMGIEPDPLQPPLWEAYPRLETAILKLTDGCPFRCTYCSVPRIQPRFDRRPHQRSLLELQFLHELGVRNIAFYDDALLFQAQQILLPFLREASSLGIQPCFHCPNALNARFLTEEVARRMVEGGFKTFFLGFESSAFRWQRNTGGKVYSEELVRAVGNLQRAGADLNLVTAYLILGHPSADYQDVEKSMRFANSLGIRVMLSEFSPIPGTPDGERCRQWVDLDEPLWHNKTVFPLVSLGSGEVQRLKDLSIELNNSLTHFATVKCTSYDELKRPATAAPEAGFRHLGFSTEKATSSRNDSFTLAE